MRLQRTIPAPLPWVAHSARARRGACPDRAYQYDVGWLLHAAAAGGRTKLLKLLLASGAEPNAAGAYGATALHQAGRKERHDSVAILLQHGAQMDILDKYGGSVRDEARARGHTGILELLRVVAARAVRVD